MARAVHSLSGSDRYRKIGLTYESSSKHLVFVSEFPISLAYSDTRIFWMILSRNLLSEYPQHLTCRDCSGCHWGYLMEIVKGGTHVTERICRG